MIIKDLSTLRKAADSWTESGVIGLDTEFDTRRTFFPIPCLYQVSDKEHRCHLLDPLSDLDLGPFKEMLSSTSIVKTLHGCQADLGIFQQALGIIPANVFDTQLAAAFCGRPHQMSYTALVSAYLGKELSKAETMSDWKQRPLTEGQLRYAQEDVIYLPALHSILQSKLVEMGRISWYEEEIQRLLENVFTEPEDHYKKFPRASSLSGRDLYKFQMLCAWRERQAQKKNRPRNWILSDIHLHRYAKQQNPGMDAFSDLPPRRIHRYKETLQALWEECHHAPPGLWPQLLPRPLGMKQDALRLITLRVAARKARLLKLPVGLLITNRTASNLLTSLRDSGKPDAVFGGWRQQVMGEDFYAWMLKMLGKKQSSGKKAT